LSKILLRYGSNAVFSEAIIGGHNGQVIKLGGGNNEAVARIIM